jgi:hypothetical protein
MKCPERQTQNHGDARFCLKCGASLALECPRCGRELPLRAMFCDGAVVRINEATSSGVEEARVLRTPSSLRGREMVFQRETTAFAGAQEYIFKHTVLREVTYERLLRRLRRIYHGLVAGRPVGRRSHAVKPARLLS